MCGQIQHLLEIPIVVQVLVGTGLQADGRYSVQILGWLISVVINEVINCSRYAQKACINAKNQYNHPSFIRPMFDDGAEI